MQELNILLGGGKNSFTRLEICIVENDLVTTMNQSFVDAKQSEVFL